jgi:DinB family protein
MQHNIEETVAVLKRTPAALNALLRDLTAEWTQRNEGSDTWSAHEVIAHLIHGEQTDWMPRVKMILKSGESATFERFDRTGHQQRQLAQGNSLDQLLDEFARLRAENLRELNALNLQPADLTRRGRHPALGVVTLSQLLATWAVHDLTHLHQISRILAHQYRDEVGPWSAYLGVLKCAGHSSP